MEKRTSFKSVPAKTRNWREVVETLKFNKGEQEKMLYSFATILIVGGRRTDFLSYLRYREEIERLSCFVGSTEAVVLGKVNTLCDFLRPLVWNMKEGARTASSQISFIGKGGQPEKDKEGLLLVDMIKGLDYASLHILGGAAIDFLGNQNISLTDPYGWFDSLESAGYAGEGLPIDTIESLRVIACLEEKVLLTCGPRWTRKD